MNYLRKHWYDLGGIFVLCIIIFLFTTINLSAYEEIMWLSLLALLLHQLEEYRIVGTFPGMINKVMFRSDMPDRFPLNTNTAFIINVCIGWSTYLAAAIFGEQVIWLGIATMMVSLGNIVAHTFLFNIKGKTFYNAGLATSWLCFAPCIYCFISILLKENLAHTTDMLIGISLGIFINVVGIFKLIDWMANRSTKYIFEKRNLLLSDRKIG